MALRTAGKRLDEAGVELVQMPKIGTGQAEGNWRVIEGLIRGTVGIGGFGRPGVRIAARVSAR